MTCFRFDAIFMVKKGIFTYFFYCSTITVTVPNPYRKRNGNVFLWKWRYLLRVSEICFLHLKLIRTQMQIRFTHGHVCNSSSAMTAVASNVHISFTVIPDDYLFLMVHRKLLMNQCPFLIRNINFIFPLNFIVCNLSANIFFQKKIAHMPERMVRHLFISKGNFQYVFHFHPWKSIKFVWNFQLNQAKEATQFIGFNQ